MAVGSLALAAVLLSVGWWWSRSVDQTHEVSPILEEVTRGLFEHSVLEQGEVESSRNVEIRCEVKSGNSDGMIILDVVDEGTRVEEGDLLVRLDSSKMEQDLRQQQIMCNTSAALVTQAHSEFDTAVISQTEYAEGTFVQEEQAIMNEVYVAEDALKKAELDLESGERLLAKGLLTRLQLEGHQSSVAKARNELEAGQTKLRVLRDFTKAKMLKQLEANIATAKARWESEQSSHQLEMDKLTDVQDQLDKCTIRAPQSGTVVHANVYSRRGGKEFVVEPGARVREQQVIVRLPDPAHMQVKAKINESRITLIKPGMSVAIRLDALKDLEIDGEVMLVNQYAEPGGWSSGNVKEYAAFIKIIEPPSQIRSGMNAEVRILVEHRPDALMVPVQALYEQQGLFFCVVQRAEKWEARLVELGSTNDKMVTIERGLQEGERVALDPDHFPSLTQLAQLTIEESPNVVSANASPHDRSAPQQIARQIDEQRPASDEGAGQRKNPAVVAGFIMQRFDTDKDRRLSTEELGQISGRATAGLERADTSGDGMIDGAELAAAVAQRMNRQGPPIPESAGAVE